MMPHEQMTTTLLLNARIVNEGRIEEGDLLIRRGRIAKLGADLQSTPADRVVDAAGKHLLPGMIDSHVHFREPGLTHKGTIRSESRAAVAGGITSFMDMPNTLPPTATMDLLEKKCAIAAKEALANYAFYLGATGDNLSEIASLDPRAACGIKVFMGASTGNLLVDDDSALTALFSLAPTLVAAHCEDAAIILENERRFRDRYGENIPMACHHLIRNEAACFESTASAVTLARRWGTRLHVLHLSTARELTLFSSGPCSEKAITCEACVHHLFFSEKDVATRGSLLKCNPAIKGESDRTALLNALREGTIDTIGTDHAPHSLEEKNRPYFNAPSGIALAQHALPCLLEHVHDGTLTLSLIVEKTAHAPARLFDLLDRGFIREGCWADLVLVDLERGFDAHEAPLHSKCQWSPFAGIHFRSSVDRVFVSGHMAYHAGRFDDSRTGMRLAFDR